VCSFPPVSPPRPYTLPSPHPYAPHDQPISFFLILSPAQYWVRSTNHLASIEKQEIPTSCQDTKRNDSYTSLAKQTSACNTDTTPTQPHRNPNTHRTKNNTTNVVIQQNSRKLLMMDILMSETCSAHKK